jgi:hypothetical protein
MFKKKKKNKEKFIELPLQESEKKMSDVPIRIKEEDDYAVLEPFDMWGQKKTSTEQKPKMSREVIDFMKKKLKKKPKHEKVVKKKPDKKQDKPKEEPKEEQKPVKKEVKKPEKKEEKPKKEEKKPEKKEEKPEEIKQKLIIQKNKPEEKKSEKPAQKDLPKPPEKTPESEDISKIPINHIETDIDELMRIIDEKKIVGLEYLSKKLKIDVNTLEDWAKMLEDRDLIEIEYPIIGLPKLRKKKWKQKS